MKTRISSFDLRLTLMLLLGALNAGALSPGPLSAQFSVRGGVSLTDFFGDDAGRTEQKTGLNMGASFSLFSIGPVQIVAEGYYRQKGALQSFDDLQGTALAGQGPPELGTFEVGLDYIEVPLLARINLPTLGGRILPYLAGGPAFAWKVECGVKADGIGGGSPAVDCDDFSRENLGETLANHERGLVLGGGFDFAVGSIGAINIDARLTRGLSRLAQGPDGPDVRNQAFSVMLGYSFGLPGALGGGGAGGPGMIPR